MQVFCAILAGFVIGYLLLPYLFPATPPSYSTRNMGARDQKHPFGFSFKHAGDHAPSKDEKKWINLLDNRVTNNILLAMWYVFM